MIRSTIIIHVVVTSVSHAILIDIFLVKVGDGRTVVTGVSLPIGSILVCI
ncbi:hypothetical protein L798_00984 [Zootermopsis nevadensis]|uniref:Uncharacterized protein n=1 Tax=Zootermopsis nevadensis TaxID=136037 RepID=A0A067QM89_ZOONE|nr:hypothetical protein L798_00984 [Zootermopsis nevadensis]